VKKKKIIYPLYKFRKDMEIIYMVLLSGDGLSILWIKIF